MKGTAPNVVNTIHTMQAPVVKAKAKPKMSVCMQTPVMTTSISTDVQMMAPATSMTV